MIITVGLNTSLDRTAIIDDLKIGKINRFERALETAGGKGLNVTRVIKTLGSSVIATGLTGGKTGEKVEELLNQEGIAHNFVRISGETRTCLAVVDKKNKTITEINENGPDVSPQEMADLAEKLEKLEPEAKIVTISGSIPSNLSPATYYDLLNIAQKRGLLTALDARGSALKKGIEAKPYIIKPNQFEAEELLGFELGGEKEQIKGLKYLLEYCSVAVITLEGKGCIIGTKESCFRLRPPEIKVVNTVGSGDAFLGGLVQALKENKSLVDIGRWGIAAGTANALTERAGLLYQEDFAKILPEVLIEKIY